MSRETTEARAGARGAAEAWRKHLKGCRACMDAKNRRRPAWRCVEGQDIANEVAAGLREVRRNIQLDAAPNPRVEKLW